LQLKTISKLNGLNHIQGCQEKVQYEKKAIIIIVDRKLNNRHILFIKFRKKNGE
jgi:hypothetical protein